MVAIKGLKDTIEWYNANAASYVIASKGLHFIPAIEKFTSYLLKGAKVLDAGCGSGRDSDLLQSKGFDMIGMDISEGLIKEAKKAYPSIDFVVGDLLDLPFPDKNFEGIWAHASLVHLETQKDTEQAISEFYRVLKSQGVVHIFVKEQLTDKKTDVVSDKLSNHDRFFQYYTKDEINKMLLNVGFEILFIEDKVSDLTERKDVNWIWAIARKTAN